MLKNLERMIFERCVAHVTLRPDAFSMENRIEAPAVRGGTVQCHLITVTYAPTRISRTYRSVPPPTGADSSGRIWTTGRSTDPAIGSCGLRR